jgi:ketol-acid reductoisomerase
MSEIKLYHDDDADVDVIKDKKIAVIGYGAQGKAQSNMMHEAGLNVVVGVREGGKSWTTVQDDGLAVATISDAAKEADIIHILIPDEIQAEVYEADIKPNLTAGKVLSFSHGFNIVFKKIVPPEGVDVIMVAPKSPGTEEYKRFKEGFGVPALIAAEVDATGQAKQVALAMAKAMRFTKAGVMECTFAQEAYEDLFGEQTVLCGGVVELMKRGFEVLTEAGYPSEMAYFEVLHEMKLIIDLVYEGGIEYMYQVVSNTAEYGGRTVGPKIIDEGTKERMKQALKRVENGEFAEEWLGEYKSGMPKLSQMRENDAKHPIEIVGRQVRALFEKK